MLSGLQHSISGRTLTGHIVCPFVLTERLSAGAVAENMFITELDADGATHSVQLANQRPEDARAALEVVASVFSAHPRGLELAQDKLRCRVVRCDDRRSLFVSPEMLDAVIHGALGKFRIRYPDLMAHGLPAPDLMQALLYGVDVRLDERVSVGIMRSLYTNSLRGNEFPSEGCRPRLIKLKSSVVALNAAIKAATEEIDEGSLEYCLRTLFDLARQCIPGRLQSGAGLSSLSVDMSVAWMRLKLTVASRNEMRHVRVHQLLHVRPVGLYREPQSVENAARAT